MIDLNTPFVTVIVPTRNEADYITHSLMAILTQSYPLVRMEVLICDGMSTDTTREIVWEFAKANPHLNIQLLNNPGGIVPTGMNIALRQAKGEILIRVDGHCIIAPDYIYRCVEHLKNDNVDGVGGPMKSIGETLIARAIALGMSSTFGVGNSAFRTSSGKTKLVDTVPFPAYSRQIIERAGLYDEELIRNQDDEYNYRIRELGGKILLADDVRSTYFGRSSLKKLWKQYFQYGYWKVRVLQKHSRQMSFRQFAPPVFVLLLFSSLFLALFPGFRSIALAVPLVYLLINLSVSILKSTQYGWNLIAYLPITFAVLHLSYGLGFLEGLISFRNRWDDKIGKTPVWANETT
jgi:cellulose synthase/poly-beta-1,6-N-acetylglucosamine synthase-like glycosyltransferase